VPISPFMKPSSPSLSLSSPAYSLLSHEACAIFGSSVSVGLSSLYMRVWADNVGFSKHPPPVQPYS
jgi:hypothetical protein